MKTATYMYNVDERGHPQLEFRRISCHMVLQCDLLMIANTLTLEAMLVNCFAYEIFFSF